MRGWFGRNWDKIFVNVLAKPPRLDTICVFSLINCVYFFVISYNVEGGYKMSNKKTNAQDIESIVTAKSVGSLHEQIKAELEAKIADPPEGGLGAVVVWEESTKNPVEGRAREIAKEKHLMKNLDEMEKALEEDENSRRH
tara:strand:+ start:88 stop:507 length:420 start_codon:yes stop_codon:yes gene_type:complete